MASCATKISRNFVENIGAELLQSAFMSLSISHWLVGFKSSMEKQRGQLGQISGNPSQKGGYSRHRPERIYLYRVIVSATRPWAPPRGLRPCAQELAGDALDRRVEVRGDFVDEADPKRGLGIEALARQEKAPRCGGTDSREDER